MAMYSSVQNAHRDGHKFGDRNKRTSQGNGMRNGVVPSSVRTRSVIVAKADESLLYALVASSVDAGTILKSLNVNPYRLNHTSLMSLGSTLGSHSMNLSVKNDGVLS